MLKKVGLHRGIVVVSLFLLAGLVDGLFDLSIYQDAYK